MSVRPIIVAPDPRLKVRCAAVERVDDAVRQLITDMLDTMYAAPGVGLAAPQIGVTSRIVVIDVSEPTHPREPLCMVNPLIVDASDELVICEEGCLSFPEHFAEVERPARVRVRYLDESGELRERDADGLLATCIQHEMDHLEGVLFVDHISALRRGMILRKLGKARKAKASA